jgi:hypothetical protein
MFPKIKVIFLILVLYSFNLFSQTVNDNNGQININSKVTNNKTIVQSINDRCKNIFPSTNKKFKILILPFFQLCNNRDVGIAIKSRLDAINKIDSLNVDVKFCSDFLKEDLIEIINNSDSLDKLLKIFNADQLIFGYYQTSDCSDSKSDIYCINYYISKKFSLKEKLRKKLTPLSQDSLWVIGTYDELKRGELTKQSIDFIAYYIAADAAFSSSNYEKSLNLFKKIENEIGVNNLFELKSKMFESFYFLNKFDEAIAYFNKEIATNNDTIYKDRVFLYELLLYCIEPNGINSIPYCFLTSIMDSMKVSDINDSKYIIQPNFDKPCKNEFFISSSDSIIKEYQNEYHRDFKLDIKLKPLQLITRIGYLPKDGYIVLNKIIKKILFQLDSNINTIKYNKTSYFVFYYTIFKDVRNHGFKMSNPYLYNELCITLKKIIKPKLLNNKTEILKIVNDNSFRDVQENSLPEFYKIIFM